jgi:tmRNA-binding protein
MLDPQMQKWEKLEELERKFNLFEAGIQIGEEIEKRRKDKASLSNSFAETEDCEED